ncbi:hypothetical protein Y032_0340g2996 [Ancylostoma ceylanicum]|uniref:Uridine diphosphate glucose pyrophosphatase NUDT14 n=2 Tax=Ancylostoma ceylanicum TaxID=53326 RepID=A0A016RXW5_9BILA|nr:hypothetical protein Y032_0340g2996 [Ancylostoma ceylanicum]
MQLMAHSLSAVPTSKCILPGLTALLRRLTVPVDELFALKNNALLRRFAPLFATYGNLLLRTKPAMAAKHSEVLTNVSFIEDFRSPYLKGVKFTFTQGGRKRSFDLVLRHSSVATLLYHTTQKKFVLVKQFRPAVLIAHVLRQRENLNKKLSEIEWHKYDASHGYTVELCAGLVDKNIPMVDIAREEIEEECGYAVKREDIHLVASFSVAAHESGGVQYLFYAEIDDSMKITEGGGNIHEGEYITKVFLTEAEAHAFLENEYPLSPPPMLYALLWWFENKAKERNVVPYKWIPRDVVPLKDLKFEPMPTSSRFVPLRMHFTLGTLTRTWDLALCDDSFAILLYNEDKKELIFTQRFRPAALVGLARHRSPPKTKLEDIDWASQPPEWAYTLEMCSGHHKRGSSAQEVEQRVRECVALKCGYRLNALQFVTSYIIGISFSGDRQRVYFAKVNDSMKVKDWKQFEDMIPYSIPCDVIPSFIRAETPTGPPAVLFMMQWFLNTQRQ